MTGYGRGQGRSSRFQFEVTVRSVNHRFLDLSLRGREQVRALESRIKSTIEKTITRGRIEAAIEVQSLSRDTGSIELNRSLLSEVVGLHQEVRSAGTDLAPLSFGDLQRIPGLMVFGEEASMDFEDGDIEALEEGLAEAIAALSSMRAQEGDAIESALLRCVEQLRTSLDEIGSSREGILEELHERLSQRLSKLLGEPLDDPSRTLQEAAILVDKSDVTEELERWAGHLDAVESTISEGGVMGKKLDFLAQEILREINTVGSKGRDLSIAQAVVDSKLACEALREQVQNVE